MRDVGGSPFRTQPACMRLRARSARSSRCRPYGRTDANRTTNVVPFPTALSTSMVP